MAERAEMNPPRDQEFSDRTITATARRLARAQLEYSGAWLFEPDSQERGPVALRLEVRLRKALNGRVSHREDWARRACQVTERSNAPAIEGLPRG